MRFVEDILVVLRDGEYLDLRIYALKALRHRIYHEEIKVTRALGDIIITDPDRILTLEAVRTLAILKNREGEEDLYRALVNDDAEIRVQASIALQALLSAEEAVATIIQRALATDTERTVIGYYVEALRRIDPDRKLSADILSKELTGQDQVRSQAAERILIDLGGWTAIHRLSQRRNTLETLDKLLAESEAAVKDTFNDTIVQAQRNFYFAMAVNIMVVIVGLVLIIIAIRQIIIDPGLLESWIVPGGAGVLGILFNLAFNNPRRNAREDLTTLMNVNVIFLGFLRQLNEIDATFKHAYIESDDFSPDDMKKTVERIEKVTSETLELARQHLLQTTGKQKGNQ
jgi:hypothetical protein